MSAFLDFRAFRGEISAEQLVSGVEAIELNAREILDDARLLLENNRHARAVSLAVIAHEESTKSLTLLRIYAVQADKKERKDAWKQYLSHIHKSSPLGLEEGDFDSVLEDASKAQEVLRKLEDEGKTNDKLKQHCFYTDIYVHEGIDFWGSPSDFSSYELAKEVVENISSSLFSRLYESSIQQRNADIREHIRYMDQHPKSETTKRFVALFESLSKAELEAAKRSRRKEFSGEAKSAQGEGSS